MSEVANSLRLRLPVDARAIAYLGAAVQLILAAVLGWFITYNVNQAAAPAAVPPETVPRAIAIPVLFAVPAVIGALGGLAGGRSLLVAAATLDVLGLVLSVATLVFAFPAFVFVFAAGRLGRQRLTTSTLGGLAVGVMVVALVVWAGLALILITEPACWIAHPTSSGIVYQSVPSIDNLPLSGVGDSAGCSSGELTVTGAAVAAGVALAAIAIAWRSVARRGPRSPEPADLRDPTVPPVDQGSS